MVISLGYSRTNGELLLFYITNMSLMHPVAADMHDEREGFGLAERGSITIHVKLFV